MTISGIKQKTLVCKIGNNTEYYLDGLTLIELSVVYLAGDVNRSLYSTLSIIEGYKTIQEIKRYLEYLVCLGQRKEIYL